MAENSLTNILKTAIEAFRLGMEAAGSEALIVGIELLTVRISSWNETDLQELNPWLERLFDAQRQKNFLYAADLLEYQILPIFTEQDGN